MKRLSSFSITSTFTFIVSILAILVIAVSAPGMVQAMFGPAASPGNVQPGNAIMVSRDKMPGLNPAGLSDTGIFGTVGIGTGSPTAPLHIYSKSSTQPETIDLDGAQPITAQWNDYCDTGGDFSGSGFLARFARGGWSSPANVQTGDRLGFNVFGGWAGGAFRHTAAIEAIVDSGTVGASSLPTYLRFSTTPNGSASRVERMRITRDGNVGIGTINPTVGKLHVESDTSGTSVYGHTTSGTGVHGSSSSSGYGVKGYSDNGVGVYGDCGSVGTAGYFAGKVQVIGSIATAYSVTAVDYTVLPTDSIIAVMATGGVRTITLPIASTCQGRQYTIKKVDSSGNAVTVDGYGSETIDGAANYSLPSRWKYVTIISDSANWLVTANN